MEELFGCIVEEYLANAPRGHRGHRDPFGEPGGIEEAEGDAALTLICGPHGSGKTRAAAKAHPVPRPSRRALAAPSRSQRLG